MKVEDVVFELPYNNILFKLVPNLKTSLYSVLQGMYDGIQSKEGEDCTSIQATEQTTWARVRRLSEEFQYNLKECIKKGEFWEACEDDVN